MEIASESGQSDVAEELLRFFVKEGLKDCFAACLYTCYDLLRHDTVLELAWRNGLTDFAMPYMIQSFKDMSLKIDKLEEFQKTQVKKNEEAEKQADMGIVAGMKGPLMITAGPGGAPQQHHQGGMGMMPPVHGMGGAGYGAMGGGYGGF
jgi:clathrin heavy chain